MVQGRSGNMMNAEQEKEFVKSRLEAVSFRHQFLGETYDHVFIASTISEEADGSGFSITKYIYDYKNETAVPFSRFYPMQQFSFHKYMPFSRFYTMLKSNALVFVSPSVWNDPYERELITVDDKRSDEKDDDKIGKKIACLCMTCERVVNEESSWNAYGSSNLQDSIIRVSYNVPAFLSRLNRIGKKKGIDFYITTIDYSLSQDGIKYMKHLVKDTQDSNDFSKRLVRYLSFKRKAFEYENEIRFFAVKSNGDDVLEKGHRSIALGKFEWTDDLISCITLPPMSSFHDDRDKCLEKLQVIRNYGLIKYLSTIFSHKKIKQCHLYDAAGTRPAAIIKKLKLEEQDTK